MIRRLKTLGQTPPILNLLGLSLAMRSYLLAALPVLLAPTLAAQTTFTTNTAASCLRPDSVRAGDLDGDGDVDVLTTHPGLDRACANLNGGTGTSWANGTLFTYAAGSGPTESVIAQFDGSGRVDVAVVLNATAQVVIHTASGAWPGFAPPQILNINQGPIEATPIDFDGDGDLDLAVICDLPQVVQILVNTGGVFAPAPGMWLAGITPTAIESGDLNGDGLADLAIAGVQTGGVAVVLINTTPSTTSPPSFAPPQVFPVDQRPFGICVGDLNGDGYNDIATANAAFSTVDVLLNDSTVLPGTTVAFIGTNYPLAPGIISGPFTEIDCGDLDCDGDLDLGVTCNASNRVAFLWNGGTGTFGAPAFFPSPLNCADLTFADFSGDGWLDAATNNRGSDSVGALINDFSAGCCEHRLIGGVSDGFTTSSPTGPEDSCPAPDLLTWFGTGTRRDFDEPIQCGATLLHTFDGLPGRIKSARLRMRMRADCSSSPDDRFALGFDGSGGMMVWSRPMTTLTGSPWVGVSYGGVSLDLGALPGGTSLLSKMSAEGRLDIVVGDDTAVDAMFLEIETCATSDIASFHNATPYIWGTTVTWSVGSAPAGGGTVFLLGSSIGPGPTLPGGSLCITSPTILTVVPTALSGTATFSVALPPLAFPPCVTLSTQAFSWNPGFTAFAHSNTLTQQFFD